MLVSFGMGAMLPPALFSSYFLARYDHRLFWTWISVAREDRLAGGSSKSEEVAGSEVHSE